MIYIPNSIQARQVQASLGKSMLGKLITREKGDNMAHVENPPPKTVFIKNPYASLRHPYADFTNPFDFAYAALKSQRNENAYASLRGADTDYQYFAVGSLRGAYAELTCLTVPWFPKRRHGKERGPAMPWKPRAAPAVKMTCRY